MLQFIQENYVWFIVGGIVLIMVIIGYFAEKTDFGAKKIEKKEKKSKTDELNEEEISHIIEENGVNQGLSDLVSENAEIPNDIIDDNQINEDLNAPFGDSDMNADFNETEESEVENNDVNTEITDIDNVEETSNAEETVETNEDIDVNTDINENAETSVEEETSNIEDITTPLPSIDEVKEDTVNSDDDIWNF